MEVMTTLERLANGLESSNKLAEQREKNFEQRFETVEERATKLENTVGRQNMVSATISAVTAGLTMGVGWVVMMVKKGGS